MATVSTPRWVAPYFALQGVGIVAWWILLIAVPTSRVWFFPATIDDAALLAFWPADAAAAVGSIVSARVVATGSSLRSIAPIFTAGCMAYAALYCVGLSAMTGEAVLAVVTMLPAAALSVTGAWLATRG